MTVKNINLEIKVKTALQEEELKHIKEHLLADLLIEYSTEILPLVLYVVMTYGDEKKITWANINPFDPSIQKNSTINKIIQAFLKYGTSGGEVIIYEKLRGESYIKYKADIDSGWFLGTIRVHISSDLEITVSDNYKRCALLLENPVFELEEITFSGIKVLCAIAYIKRRGGYFIVINEDNLWEYLLNNISLFL